MARTAIVAALVAVLAIAANVRPAAANAQVCNPGLTPATPTNVRVKSNVWNGKNAGEFWGRGRAKKTILVSSGGGKRLTTAPAPACRAPVGAPAARARPRISAVR